MLRERTPDAVTMTPQPHDHNYAITTTGISSHIHLTTSVLSNGHHGNGQTFTFGLPPANHVTDMTSRSLTGNDVTAETPPSGQTSNSDTDSERVTVVVAVVCVCIVVLAVALLIVFVILVGYVMYRFQ